ncbi:MAG: hypothetical protein KGJ51_02445, partial [Acidobacteriota bacterium]|nr:hypothetical protein [Acidobacteriota bacterium]
ANHNPVLVVNGSEGTAPIDLDATVGQTVTLDAKGSRDPDGQQLSYHWWVYPEAGVAGSHGADVALDGADGPVAKAQVKALCAPVWIPNIMPCRTDGVTHIILEVTDDGTPALTSYRRVILHVHAAAADGATGK